MSFVSMKWQSNFDRRIAFEPSLTSNKVWIEGTVIEDFEFNHCSHGSDLYVSKVSTQRDSGTLDIVNVMASRRLLETISLDNIVGKKIQVAGKLITWKRMGDDGIYKITIFVLAQSIIYPVERTSPNNNIVYISGNIGYLPNSRKTYTGKSITDIVVVTEKGYGEYAYVPCITWGSCAEIASKLKKGTTVEIYGRLQSREIHEKNELFYEVSAYTLAFTTK